MPFFPKKGGKDKKRNWDCSYEHVDEDELPQLHKLVFNFEKTSKLKSFISKKVVNINEKDNQGRTALHLAAASCNEKALLVLFGCGSNIDVDVKDHDGKTALFKAVEVFSHQCVLILTEHGASTDIWDAHESTPLHIATVNKKPLIIAVISNANGNVNIKDKMGYTPLHVAAAFGYLEIGKQLIECGADVDARDSHGRTPLMAASCEGTPKMVRLLLEHCANPILKDQFNHSAVYYSVQNHSESMTMILKEAVGQRRCLNQNSNEPENIVDRKSDDEEPRAVERIASPVSFYKQGQSFQANRSQVQNSLRSTRDKPVIESFQEIEAISVTEATPFTPEGEMVVKKESFRSEPSQENITEDTSLPANKSVADARELGGNGSKKEVSFAFIGETDVEKETLNAAVDSRIFICKESQTQENPSTFETQKDERIARLKQRNKELRGTNTQLRKRLSEMLKQTANDREEHKQSLGYDKAQFQFLSLKNQKLLEEKIKQCVRLESTLHEAHGALLSEIERTKEGKNTDQLFKDMIQGMRKKLKASEAKIIRLTKQCKVAREEKSLLDTEVESLRGEVIILNEIITKKRKEQKYFDEINNEPDDNSLGSRETLSKLYEDELENRMTDNEALLDSLNNLRKENAMLKEQHISDKHETQLINCELNDARDQILTLRYQIETIKLGGAASFNQMSSQRDSFRRQKLSLGSGKYIERAKSDSTVHGFRTFDSTFEFLNDNEYNK